MNNSCALPLEAFESTSYVAWRQHWTLAKETNLLLHGGSPLSPFLAPELPQYTMEDLKSAFDLLKMDLEGYHHEVRGSCLLQMCNGASMQHLKVISRVE